MECRLAVSLKQDPPLSEMEAGDLCNWVYVCKG